MEDVNLPTADLSQSEQASEQSTGEATRCATQNTTQPLPLPASPIEIIGDNSAQHPPSGRLTATLSPFPRVEIPEYPPQPLPRRKPAYSKRACLSCRRRKMRCDDIEPTCGPCTRLKVTCEYPPSRNENQPMAVAERLDTMQDGITKLLQLLPRLSVQPKPRAMPFSLEAYLGAQQEIEVSAEQQRVVQNLEDSLHKLSSFPNWPLLSGRLVSFISDLRAHTLTTEQPPHQEGAGASSEPVLIQGGSRSHMLQKRKFEDDVQEKKFFCFHESCEQSYNSEKLLGNHIRNTHKDRWPDLPGTCDHEGSVKKFRTWEECLTHLTFHQRAMGMRRKEYDKIQASAQFWVSYSNQRVGRDGLASINGSPIDNVGYSPASNSGYGTAWDSAANTFLGSNPMGSMDRSPVSNSGNRPPWDIPATDSFRAASMAINGEDFSFPSMAS
ncbi:hypothetical protein EPUS_05938 [Endocarpon pusillum Z07020]|uniref:Zn(2)-C6 fungal-type domain-containing protein n=1 Tax=Endocarpon pusillum (strain Z07020 / HMAS-L-300199) TaxID=1263415 RepID=U1GBH2_ENDPU|nr:uncharacterized protein EPUS_05938 [Endocarpon pusillum Z07020]ERF69393.1 hypothetical protein EPUS_05938 [Endocarpon pusillum Z07020]